MSERLASLRRIAAVQAIVRRRAEIALEAAEREKAAVEAQRRELDRFAEGDLYRGDLGGLIDAQGRRLARRDDAAAGEIARRAVAARAAQARHKLIDEAVGRAAQDERAWTERHDLERLIEELAGRPDPSR